MVINSGMKPTAAEKSKYLAKIEEWESLGFDVTGLAELLETDFGQFKKRRLEILRGQISETAPSVPEPRSRRKELERELEEPELEDEEEVYPIDEPPEDDEPDEVESTIMVGEFEERSIHEPDLEPPEKDDKLVLIGKPLPVEPPPPDDEETILVGEPDEKVKADDSDKSAKEKIKTIPAAAHIREIGSDEESLGIKRKVKEEEDEETFDDDKASEMPAGIVGTETPVKKKGGKTGESKRKRASAGARKTRKGPSNKVAALGITGILIMAVLFWMIYVETQQGDGNGNGGEIPGELEAVIEVDRTTATAGETIYFNAQNSKGDLELYKWVFDTDFIMTAGSLTSVFVSGYFAQVQTVDKAYIVTLTVETAEGQVDTVSLTITINPFQVTVVDEMLGDSSTSRVEGDITITNPDNIASVTQDTGSEAFGDITISVNKMVLNFKNQTGDPILSKISPSSSKRTGFMDRLHDVFSREITQNLDIDGYMEATIESAVSDYEEPLPITGTMNSVETSYVDYTTDHTVQIFTTNDLQLSTDITDPVDLTLPMQSNDELVSYPDLRSVPSRLRLADLSSEPIGLGDRDTVVYGTVAYSWYAVTTDQVLGSPALKLEFDLDSATLNANNIHEFYLHLWLGNNKPVPLKSDLHVKLTLDGNTVEVNHATRLIEYLNGDTALTANSCSQAHNVTHHYPERYSDIDTAVQNEFSSGWTYLPKMTESGMASSFEQFTPDDAMATHILTSPGVNNYLANNPDAYVVTGYCNRTNGELIWNITFGTEGSTSGYNILVGETSGVIYGMDVDINDVKNSTSEFWPVLTFAGSEYIFKDIGDSDINANIFQSDNVDFDTVSYGVTAGLSYPTVDFTSVTSFQTQRLSYFAVTKDGKFYTAIDAETGQLLFKLKHDYSGIDLPY